jgi:UDP-glucose 4-epimerase
MSKRRVLVTGVAGFIGSHVAEDCLKEGFEVVGVDDLSGGFIENVPAGVEFVEGDISDEGVVLSLFQGNKFDFVYHLAAYAAEGLSHFIRRFNYVNNLIGSINLINQSVLNAVKCFVFTSSIAVYGTNQIPMHEDMTPQPEDPYGIAKYAIEQDLAAAYHMFGLNYIVFRPHNVYGERQNIADKYRNVIGIFMNQVMKGQPMTIFGDGLQTRSFSHVSDVSPIIARSPLFEKAYRKVFNIGADQPYTVNELAEVVARELQAVPTIEYLPARKEVVHAVASHERVKEIFAPSAPLPLKEGIQRMAEWARKHGARSPVEFGNIEVPINLPPSWIKSS